MRGVRVGGDGRGHGSAGRVLGVRTPPTRRVQHPGLFFAMPPE